MSSTKFVLELQRRLAPEGISVRFTQRRQGNFCELEITKGEYKRTVVLAGIMSYGSREFLNSIARIRRLVRDPHDIPMHMRSRHGTTYPNAGNGRAVGRGHGMGKP